MGAVEQANKKNLAEAFVCSSAVNCSPAFLLQFGIQIAILFKTPEVYEKAVDFAGIFASLTSCPTGREATKYADEYEASYCRAYPQRRVDLIDIALSGNVE